MSKKKFPKKDAMKTFADKVWTALEASEKEGKLFWNRPWRTIDTSYRNAFSNHTYKGLHNILMCLLSGYSDPRYMTFNQVRKNNGKVKKGAKSVSLIAWNFKKIQEKQKDGTEKEKTIPFSKVIPVFNVEQTEGLDLPEIDKDVLNEDVQPNKQVMDIFTKLNVTIDHKKSNKAYYAPSEDRITIPLAQQFEKEEDWAATGLHELVHWTAKRVKRDCSQYQFDTSSKAFEELVAELGSMFLCMKLKINNTENKSSLAYISSWKKASEGTNGKKFVYKACKLAEEAATYILQESGIDLEEKDEQPNKLREAS